MTDTSHPNFNPLQQITKYRLIASQIDLIADCRDKLFTIKQLISLTIKPLNCSQLQRSKQSYDCLKQYIDEINDRIKSTQALVNESNKQFQCEFHLRDEIKFHEQNFFKKILQSYENRIKGLKQYLLIIEGHVQQLQEKGCLPFADDVERNFTLLGKSKFLNRWAKKQTKMKQIAGYGQLLTPKTSQSTTFQLETLKNQITRRRKNNKEIKKEQLLHQNLSDEDTEDALYEILKNRLTFEEVRNWKIRQNKAKVLSCLEEINQINKNLKEQCNTLRKITKNQLNQIQVHDFRIDFTREECLDFLREMNKNLQVSEQKKQNTQIPTKQQHTYRSKSQPSKNYLFSNDSFYHDSSIGIKDQKRVFVNPQEVLKDIRNTLYNSFLEQCTQVISGKNIDDGEHVEEMSV